MTSDSEGDKFSTEQNQFWALRAGLSIRSCVNQLQKVVFDIFLIFIMVTSGDFITINLFDH